MAAPNIVNVTELYGKSTSGTLTTGSLDLLVNAASSGLVLKVNSIYVANVDGTNSADATILYYDAGRAATAALAKGIPVPAKTTLVILDKNAPLYLEEGDKIQGLASASSDLEYVISWEEIS